MSSIIPLFQAGEMTTSFLDETPELFEFTARRDRATKLLTYLADMIVNGNPEVAGKPRPAVIRERRFPASQNTLRPRAPGNCSTRSGRQKFAEWTLDQTRLLMTDTTFRDAHQSLMATRVRTLTSCASPIMLLERTVAALQP